MDKSIARNGSTNRKEGGCISALAELVLVTFLMAYSVFRSIIGFILPAKYKNISNEIILITGGGKGLGRFIAVEFAKCNPKHIILWGRHEDTLSATAKAIRIHGIPCTYNICDVSDPGQVTQVAKQIIEDIGDVTMLVNNAAVVHGKTVADSTFDEIQNTMNTNTLAQFWTTKAFLPSMLKHNHGHVVSVNSTLGMMGLAGAADYCASKYACRGLSESLLLEVLRAGKTGIHITDIHPGHMDTEMFSGMSHRFPKLFPALNKEYVAAQTVKAVLRNKREVIMPRTMYFFFLIKSILPVEAIFYIYNFLELDKAMDNFHGRKKAKLAL